MVIVGYVDKVSVSFDEKIRFMVSSDSSEYYATIVRLIHGDQNKKGPGFKEEVFPTQVNGRYAARKQVLHHGSFVAVPSNLVIERLQSLTLTVWVYPTKRKRSIQGLLTKWGAQSEPGFGLFIGEEGDPVFCLRTMGNRNASIRTELPLTVSRWHFLAASYEAKENRISIFQKVMQPWPYESEKNLSSEVRDLGNFQLSNRSPLLMGATRASIAEENDEVSPAAATSFFDGKLDNPQIFNRALSYEEVVALYHDNILSHTRSSLLASWDFSQEISSITVRDTSSNKLHGETINTPARAVTGHKWNASETDFRFAGDQYGAIYFHDDDLDDARWEPSFELTVPHTMKSGIYAARLRAENGDEDYIPFFVKPQIDKPTSKIALLIPTCSYLAYANEHFFTSYEERSMSGAPPGYEYPLSVQDKYIVENRLHSLYDVHSDGSGVYYASYLRPMPNIRPKYNQTYTSQGRGSPHQLNADLHLVNWLETKGFGYDVITDHDLHFEGPKLLSNYKVVLTGTHPEYYTEKMLDAWQTYLRNGGRMMYLGGNGFFGIVTIDEKRPHMMEIRRQPFGDWIVPPGEGHHSMTGEQGGLWTHRGRSSHGLCGVGNISQGFDINRPYNRHPSSFDQKVKFIFDGIGEDELIGNFDSLVQDYGAAGFEIDCMDYTLGTPTHTLLLASASGFSPSYKTYFDPPVLLTDSRVGGLKGRLNPFIRADMVYIEYPNNGAVFSVGSIAWCGCLYYNNYDNNVSRITENVLRKFLS